MTRFGARSAAPVLAVALLAGCSAGGETPQPDTAAVEQAGEEEEPEQASEPEATKTSAPDAAASTGDDVNSALREALGIFGDATYQSLTPDRWGFYIADVEVPHAGLARITMQVDGSSADDLALVEGASKAIFSLIGAGLPDLNTVEIVDGGGIHIEQTFRRDVALLSP